MCFAPTGILCLHILYGQCLSDCEAEYKIRDSSLNPIHYGAVSTLSGGGAATRGLSLAGSCTTLFFTAGVWLCFNIPLQGNISL